MAPSPTPPCGRSSWSSTGATADRRVVEKLDALERLRGRQPGTAYLRARVAHLLGTEDPRVIAERASSLAMSMNSFPELELLAAEAWDQAGERKRALAYARDLADNPQVDPVLRARARALVEVAPPSEVRPQSASRVSVPPPAARAPSDPPPYAPPPSVPPARSESAPMVAITAGLRGSIAPGRSPSARCAAGSERAGDATGRPSVAPLPEESGWEDDHGEPIAPTPIVSIGVGLARAPRPRRAPLPELPPASSAAIRAAQRESQSSMRPPRACRRR